MNNLNLDFLQGIVPCGTSLHPNLCTVCDFFKLIQNIINFLFFVSVPLVTAMAIYIGFLFMVSGGSPKLIQDAKSKLWLLLWGMIWIFGSWMVLDTALNVLVNKSVFPWPWNQIQCSVTTSSLQTSSQETTPSQTPTTPTLPATTLSEQEARDQLKQSGISINKNPCPPGVAYQNVSGGCTSLNGVKASTVEEAIQLKNDCNCQITITGGTELGHETGPVSHSSGNKLDFGLNSQLDQYVRANANYMGLRSDGAQQWRMVGGPLNGTIFALEGNHWDTTFVK